MCARDCRAATHRPRMPCPFFFKKCRAASVCWPLLLPKGSMQGAGIRTIGAAVMTMLVHIRVPLC